jgi:hypothetical protein
MLYIIWHSAIWYGDFTAVALYWLFCSSGDVYSYCTILFFVMSVLDFFTGQVVLIDKYFLCSIVLDVVEVQI